MHNEGPYVCLRYCHSWRGAKRRKKKNIWDDDWLKGCKQQSAPSQELYNNKIGLSWEWPKVSTHQCREQEASCKGKNTRLKYIVQLADWSLLSTWGGSCLLLLKLPYLKENYDVSDEGKRDGLTPRDEEGRSQPSAIFSGLAFCWSANWTDSVQSLVHVRASTRAASHNQGQRPTLSHSSKTLNQLKPQCITSPSCICLQSRPITSEKKINNASFFNKWYNSNNLGRRAIVEWA